MLCLAAACPSRAAVVDTLRYFLQDDSKSPGWILDGTDVQQGTDPERRGLKAIILTKFNDSTCYEVYSASDSDIQIRYEVYRAGGAEGKGNWIRRFEEIRSDGSTSGAVWMKRFMTPGGEGYLSHYRQDRFMYDEKTGTYIFDPSGSNADMKTYISVAWARLDPGANDRTGFHLDKVLRMISEWQNDGLIIETYDYALGKGLVNWRWLELLGSLRPIADDKTGELFYCEGGCVRVVSRGSVTEAPVVYKYDLGSHTQRERLEVVKMTSHWRKSTGPQWYVVYRNLVKEHALMKREGRIDYSFALPEWKGKPNATIADLPYVNTRKID